MRALRFHESGSFDKLKLETLPDPHPRPDELVVRIRATSLNPSDAKNVLGRMEGATLPRTPGRDFAGVVLHGPANTIGGEVWGTGGDIGFARDGAHAELLVVPVAVVRPKPLKLVLRGSCRSRNEFRDRMDRPDRNRSFSFLRNRPCQRAAGGVGSAVTQIAK